MKHDTQFSFQSNAFAKKILEINSVGFAVALQVTPVREVSTNAVFFWERKIMLRE